LCKSETFTAAFGVPVDDAAEYHEVLIAGYAENKNYPISFDAINFSQ